MNKKANPIKLIGVLLMIAGLLFQYGSVYSANGKKGDPVLPPAPTNLTASAVGETFITLKWTASSAVKGVASYLVYKDGNQVAACKTTSFTVTGLCASTTYQFYIRIKDKDGNLSATGNIITVTTAALAVPPPTSSLSSSIPSSTATSVSSSVTSLTSSASSAVSFSPPTSSVATSEISSVTSAVSSAISAVSSAPSSAPAPVSSEPSVPAPAKIVAGYYASWSAYSGYTPVNIPAQKLSHVNYAFAKIGSDLKIALGGPTVDTANFEKLNALKAAYPHLKTLISVGGWTYSDKFSDAALTDASRTVFADSVVAFIKQYNFDGVDIDWEYPVSGGLSTNTYRTSDKTNFTLLMKKLREKLDAQGEKDGKKYLLTFAGGAGSTYVKNTELDLLGGIVDYAIIMTYDLHGPWDTYTDFNAPLYAPSTASPQYQVSVDSCVRAWLSAGFPASKLVLGVPFYGYIYNGVANANNGLFQRYTSGKSISYDSVVSGYLSNSTYGKFLHPDAKVPYLFNGSVFITYDNAPSLTQKADYVNQNNLAGTCAWELSQNKDGTLINAISENLK